jgi:hypothetical protein
MCREPLRTTQLKADHYTKVLIDHFKQKEAKTAAKERFRRIK